MAVVDAFSAGTTGMPDWGAAKVITGYRGPEDVLSPQLRQWAARKGKEEVDLHQARLKMKEGRRALTDEAGAVADGSLPPTAAPKKGEPKKKGRGPGLSPPAQRKAWSSARDQAGLTPKIGPQSWSRHGEPVTYFHYLVHRRCAKTDV